MKEVRPLDFQPESEESAKARFGEVLRETFVVSDNPESQAAIIRAVRRQRKHIFDFADGIRMFASVQQEEGFDQKQLQLVFCSMGEKPIPPKTFVDRVRFLRLMFVGNLEFIEDAWLPPNQPTAKSYHAFFRVP